MYPICMASGMSITNGKCWLYQFRMFYINFKLLVRFVTAQEQYHKLQTIFLNDFLSATNEFS